ncbi:MAG: sensor histidine kinase KdpD [Rhodospirillaceae bacterium]
MAERSDGNRPSPEALLDEVKREHFGRLKVFLGAAPGVGKTYAMLRTAQYRRREGVDIVIGVVETHGRRETEGFVRGLETIPRKKIEYRGLYFEEMDIDAILTRRPKVVLVDELAHTNVPGSRHPKRHQDVAELLEAGIDVYSTVNIQHLESLNDVIARIAGIQVRETVPDHVLQKADEIEVIDLPPHDLMQRLAEGKVYIPDQARRAMQNYFTPGNLTALRELALRYAAERVDEQMISYMRAHAIQGPWPTRERIMVCIGDDESAHRLVRTGKRAAERRQAPWLVVYVETSHHQTLPDEVKDNISAALKLAEQLGAETLVLSGEDVAQEIVGCARQRNCSQLVIGRSHRPTWTRLFRRSITEALLDRGQTFDVLVITSEETPTIVSRVSQMAKRGIVVVWKDYLFALALAAGAMGAAYLGDTMLQLSNLALVFMVAVLIAGVRGGLGPSILVSLISFAAYTYFFKEHRNALLYYNWRDVFEFVAFLGAAVVIGNYTAGVRQQVKATKHSARRTANLYDFSRKIAGEAVLDDVLWVVVHHVASTIQGRALVLMRKETGLEIVAGYPPEDQLDAVSGAAAHWAWNHGKIAGRGSATLPGSEWLFLPLRTARGPVGVLGVAMQGSDKLLSSEQTRLLDALAGQAAVAIERTTLVSDIEQQRLLTETERLRAALLSSISHDLRTPLVAIIGSVTTLLSYGESFDPVTRHDLLMTIQDEAERLNRFVQNLLDMTRLGSGALQLRLDWVDIQDIIGSALERVKKHIVKRPLDLRIAPGLPLLHLDFVLIEQVMVNIIDNSCKYSPAGSRIIIDAGLEGKTVLVAVTDQGPGIPENERERVFDMFYRVKTSGHQTMGTGLGLAICRGIVEAHGGTVSARSGSDNHGTVITIGLPVAEAPPLPSHLDETHKDEHLTDEHHTDEHLTDEHLTDVDVSLR